MSDLLAYTLSLNDKFSSTMKKIGINSDNALNSFAKIQTQAVKVETAFKTMGVSVSTLTQKVELLRNERDLIPAKNITDIHKYNAEIKKTETEIEKLQGTSSKGIGKSLLGGIGGAMSALGIGVGLYKVGTWMSESVEKAHALHLAEAQLSNTMKNMGTYSAEAYEKIITGSNKMAAGINFTAPEIVGLQSQLRLVGNIGETEMQRLVGASADMATKFEMPLTEAGNSIAKAINNPEMMRRLSMQLKIDPAIVDKIQNLAKNGQEAAARLELIKIVEGKIGGAAKAAFDAEPLNKYKKTMESIQLKLGEAATKLKIALAPALVTVAGYFKKFIDLVVSGVTWLTEHKKIALALAVGLGILAVAIVWTTIVTKVKAAWDAIVSVSTGLWTVAQWALNSAFYACPIVWVIALIIALIAAIAYVIYKTDGWGETWSNLVNYMSLTLKQIGAWFTLKGLEIADSFLTAFEFIEKGWYHLKKLWDKSGGDAGLKKIENQKNARMKELIEQQAKIDGLSEKRGEMKVWAMKWNDKSLSDITGGLKKKLGIPESTIPGTMLPSPTNPNPGDKTGGASEAIASGGTRNTAITINLKNLVENINYTGGVAENETAMEKQITEGLIRVLQMAYSTV